MSPERKIGDRRIDLAWLMLVLLSVGGAGIGSSDANAVLVAVGVSLVMAIKLRLVCTYFLELHEAHLKEPHNTQVKMYLDMTRQATESTL